MFRKFTEEEAEWFSRLWEDDSNEYEFFELAQAYNPGISFDEFDHGWQFTTVLNEDYETAVEEFYLAAHNAV